MKANSCILGTGKIQIKINLKCLRFCGRFAVMIDNDNLYTTGIWTS